MLNLDKNKFSIHFVEGEDNYEGRVDHPDLGTRAIFIRSIDMDLFEKYDIFYMNIECPTDKTGDSMIADMLKELPDCKSQIEKYKEKIKGLVSGVYVINVDKKTCNLLRNNDKYATAFLYHEIGHFMHSDETYPTENRESMIYAGKVSQKELDADDFAFDVWGEKYYDAMKMIQKRFLEAAQPEADMVFLLDATELKLRIKHLVNRIQEARSKR